ncbi:MAG: SCP2 sterol-binding domain-containing protein [Anaerolineae bacterium]|nr:SCP2 sterol-binding domain-containing protein [Anaerolineae bacterium]
MALKVFFRPEAAQKVNETYGLHLGEETLHVHVNEGEIQVHQSESQKADATFHIDMQVFLGLFTGQLKPEEVIEQDLIQIEGDPGVLGRFLSFCYVPVQPA